MVERGGVGLGIHGEPSSGGSQVRDRDVLAAYYLCDQEEDSGVGSSRAL